MVVLTFFLVFFVFFFFLSSLFPPFPFFPLPVLRFFLPFSFQSTTAWLGKSALGRGCSPFMSEFKRLKMDPDASVVKWSCDYCTYENYPSSLKCVMCRAPKRTQYIQVNVTVRGLGIVSHGGRAWFFEAVSSLHCFLPSAVSPFLLSFIRSFLHSSFPFFFFLLFIPSFLPCFLPPLVPFFCLPFSSFHSHFPSVHYFHSFLQSISPSLTFIPS